uniref:Portal protein n=1 Tax=Hot spring virus BHS1 TaxID=2024351 RepID=A0A2Y9CIC6_9VIRU|nr:hypothetical protein [Hot spring virus BHS1]
MTSDSLDANADFGDFAARQARYAIYWAFFENTAYRNIHGWATKFKADYGLYKYTRNIYNPAYRLCDFWRTHIWGGPLDPEAGVRGALPIITDNESLRVALAKLWRDSNWAINKNLCALHGSLFGDTFIQPVDDVERRKVYLKLIHPGIVKDVTLDPFGNVKAYVIEEKRPDPNDTRRMVTYTEIVGRDGDLVTFETRLNNQPYAWNGKASEWTEPYGFVPLVKIQHANMGLDWGWSELHPVLSKVREVDDIASKVSDQIRKNVDAPMLLSGVTKPTTTPRTQQSATAETGREEIPVLYGPVGATVNFLVAPLNIADSIAHIRGILEEMERDYPELQMDIWAASGQTSGRALRTARQRVEAKVHERRANYDDGLVRAQQMAIAIGGFRGYDGYEGFGLESYKAGALDHSIGARPVFAADPLDDIELKQAFWAAAGAARAAGGMAAMVHYLREAGWSEDDIRAVQDAPENAPFANYP